MKDCAIRLAAIALRSASWADAALADDVIEPLRMPFRGRSLERLHTAEMLNSEC